MQQSCKDIWFPENRGTAHTCYGDMTVQKSEIYGAKAGDIGTYLEEMVPSFIMGQKDIDAEWDSFVEEQKNMSIQTVIDIYQKAYDAYWA